MNRRAFLPGHWRAWPAARAIRARASTSTTGRPTSRPRPSPDFEAEFGVRVRYATYESNEEMLAKVLTGNSGWDVVFPTHNRLEPMREYGLLAPLRPRLAPRPAPISTPRFRAPAWDPELAVGRALHVERHRHRLQPQRSSPPPARWADLWEPRLKGRLTMLDDPEDMLGACLKKLGLPFSATDPGAVAPRRAAKPSRRSRCCAPISMPRCATSWWPATCWPRSSGPPPRSRPSTPRRSWRSPIPAEGFPFYCDCAVILRESRRARLAHQLPRLPAAPRSLGANRGSPPRPPPPTPPRRRCCPTAVRQQPRALSARPISSPAASGRAPLPPAAQRLRDRIWTEIKSA